MNHPKFGDQVLNTAAGESNPRRIGYFVRAIHRNGRTNTGTWYQCTDQKGNFWETDSRSIQIIQKIRPESQYVKRQIFEQEPDFAPDAKYGESYQEWPACRCGFSWKEWTINEFS